MQVNYQTQKVSSPAIQTGTAALVANAARIGWMIQNLSTGTLAVILGSVGSSAVFHTVLQGCTAASDGKGGIHSEMSGVCFTEAVYVAGSSISYVVTEFAP